MVKADVLDVKHLVCFVCRKVFDGTGRKCFVKLAHEDRSDAYFVAVCGADCESGLD